MSRMADRYRTIEGRRGSRIDFEEGDRCLNIPRNRALTCPHTSHPGVQGTGCGTRGSFALARFAAGKTGKEWLLMKKKDEHADPAWTLKSELTPKRLKDLTLRTPPCETS